MIRNDKAPTVAMLYQREAVSYEGDRKVVLMALASQRIKQDYQTTRGTHSKGGLSFTVAEECLFLIL